MLTDAHFKFALKSLRKCMLIEPRNNIFFSPHLLYQNLLMAYFGSAGDIENSLRQILCIPDHVTKPMLVQYYKSVGMNQFCYMMNGLLNFYTCRIFNRIWINQSKTLRQEASNLFSSGHQVLWMSNFEFRPNNIRLFINNYISSITECRIQDLLPPNTLDSDTDIVMTNAIYLRGQLKGKVFPSVAQPRTAQPRTAQPRTAQPRTAQPRTAQPRTAQPRTAQRRTAQPSTSQPSTSQSASGSNTQTDFAADVTKYLFLTEVPLQQNHITVLFIRSSSLLSGRKTLIEDEEVEMMKIIAIMELLTTDEMSQHVRKWLDDGLPHQCCVYPTFKVEQNLKMNELLKILDVDEFIPRELFEFTEDDSLTLGSAMHRVSIEMTENDITAAASNAFLTINLPTLLAQNARTRNISSNVHMPSICIIYDKFHRNILFCGVLWNIKKSKTVMI